MLLQDYGGDEAAYKSASNDLIGLRLFNKVDIDGLYTLATAVINYRGYRIIAQSIIAGLFSSLMQQDESSQGPSIQIVYGSLEGEEMNTDPEFHSLVVKAAKELYLKVRYLCASSHSSQPHKVVDKKGEEIEMAAHANIKGIKGTDGRRYVLDLVRTTPRDYNYKDNAHLTAILRPELIDLYIKTERDKFLVKHIVRVFFSLSFFFTEGNDNNNFCIHVSLTPDAQLFIELSLFLLRLFLGDDRKQICIHVSPTPDAQHFFELLVVMFCSGNDKKPF